ncbi:MAG: hypothetical protein LQ344_003573 [Seirophora lacunosa]|nr:MAG: hypothetical protein LQ344_003573 [Seirophora lacunosa]
MEKQLTDRERFPRYYVEHDIDRRKCERVVPMKVLVIGMLRTGTLSMQAALEELGFGPCYHMHFCFQNPMECEMWTEALNAKFQNKGRKYTKKEWDQLLGHCQAITDVPASAFIPELHEAYPDAKVVIVQRAPDSWYRSCQRTVMTFTTSKQLPLLYFLDRYMCRRMAPMMQVLFTSLFGSEHKDPVKMKQDWIRGYMDAYQEARTAVPEEQRLEFALEQGWGPLCEFLGVEVPTTPFPHRNDSSTFETGIKVLIKRMWVRAAKQNAPYVVAAVGVAAAWWLYQ